MPPRVVKKSPASGKKTATRTTKASSKPPQDQADAPEETVIVNEVDAKKDSQMEEIVDVEPKKVTDKEVVPDNGSVHDEDGPKDIYEDEDKGERLELDDHEPEDEPDEEAAVDYDERMIDDDGQDVDEGEEEVEEGDVVEEEEDMVIEETEDGGEDVEDEGDQENVEEEQEDGEEEEHHEMAKELRKRKEFEVFVGGLDKDATEDDLRKVFSEVGEITEVRLLMNPHTKKNKGFAFLRFATVDQAKRAVTELKNPIINGKQCGVAQSQDSDTLFLGNVCKTWTKEHLKEKIKGYGVDTIEELILVEDTSNEGMNRGFAFLEFSSRADAMDAYRRLQKRDVVFGVERSAKVAFADSFIEPDDEIMSQVKTVFVDGIPPAWDEEKVKEHVKKFGKIEKVELARNMPAAKRKDFGFVTFDVHEAAVACVESLNNADLGEGDTKVKVRARLSRPLQRGRGKRVARGGFRVSRFPTRDSRATWVRAPPRRLPLRVSRGIMGRGASLSSRGLSVRGRGLSRPVGFRDRRPIPPISERTRRLPPAERSYRRPPVPVYSKGISKRDYDRREHIVPRSRAIAEYGSRIPSERRQSYGDDYSRGGGYSDIPPRSLPRSAERRAYADEGYGRKLERNLPPHRETRSRDYDSISGSKRPYSTLDDAHSRYADVSMKPPRPRLDYAPSGGSSQYEDSYSDRLGRSHLGYGSSRSSISGRDSQALYGGRHGISYSSGSDVDGLYSSSGYGSGYLSRSGSDVGGSTYSSLYSGRSLGGSSYLRGSGSGSYY